MWRGKLHLQQSYRIHTFETNISRSHECNRQRIWTAWLYVFFFTFWSLNDATFLPLPCLSFSLSVFLFRYTAFSTNRETKIKGEKKQSCVHMRLPSDLYLSTVHICTRTHTFPNQIFVRLVNMYLVLTDAIRSSATFLWLSQTRKKVLKTQYNERDTK